MNEFDFLTTEERNKATMLLDKMSPLEIVTIMNAEDENVIKAVRKCLPQIAGAIQLSTEAMKKGGRIIYMGAGTSGRLGVLDAAECQPTFGVPSGLVLGLIAGGEKAFLQAVECAEDSEENGKNALKKLNLSEQDIVVGLAASGRTPYVIGGLRYAAETGCHTVAVSCNADARISQEAEIAIEVITGPEVLTGSTRLKAGTAQKMVLNMLSTGTMVGLGKVYENLMVDVVQTNEKLVHRAENIVMEAAGCDRGTARRALANCNGSAKIAIVSILLNENAEVAEQLLKEAGGHIREALKSNGRGNRENDII